MASCVYSLFLLNATCRKNTKIFNVHHLYAQFTNKLLFNIHSIQAKPYLPAYLYAFQQSTLLLSQVNLISSYLVSHED